MPNDFKITHKFFVHLNIATAENNYTAQSKSNQIAHFLRLTIKMLKSHLLLISLSLHKIDTPMQIIRQVLPMLLCFLFSFYIYFVVSFYFFVLCVNFEPLLD